MGNALERLWYLLKISSGLPIEYCVFGSYSIGWVSFCVSDWLLLLVRYPSSTPSFKRSSWFHLFRIVSITPAVRQYAHCATLLPILPIFPTFPISFVCCCFLALSAFSRPSSRLEHTPCSTKLPHCSWDWLRKRHGHCSGSISYTRPRKCMQETVL